jgi:beta-aspartyl-peptidase (threonine type)
MRPLVCLLLLPLFALAEEPAEAKKAIQAVLDAQQAAWNKGDLEGFMAGYWKSEKLTFYSGKDVKQGWQATFDRYKARYQAPGSEMGKLTFSDESIDVVGAETAIVRGRWKLDRKADTLEGLYTLLMRKFPEGWRIVHDHTSGTDPVPKKSGNP